MSAEWRSDIARYLLVKAPYGRSRFVKGVLILIDSDLHCVMAYRFGRYTDSLRSRKGALSIPVLVVYKVWHRWVTHIHHVDISKRADIGPGLLLMHRHGVMIGPITMGRDCVVHQNVTLGERIAGGAHDVPELGDRVWIGPGAILSGGITVGDDVTISAGTVLSKSVSSGCLVGGNPGRVLAQEYRNEFFPALSPAAR